MINLLVMIIDKGRLLNGIEFILITNLLLILVPLIITNTAHMIVVKKNIFPFMNFPIHRKLFGESKTWRGVIVLTLFGEIAFQLTWFFLHNWIELPFPVFGIGAAMGFVYAISELPNSWFKRKLGLKSGETSRRFKLLFQLLDKLDSATGVAVLTLMIYLFYPGAYTNTFRNMDLYPGNQPDEILGLPFNFAVATILGILIIENCLTHILFSIVLVKLRIKKSF